MRKLIAESRKNVPQVAAQGCRASKDLQVRLPTTRHRFQNTALLSATILKPPHTSRLWKMGCFQTIHQQRRTELQEHYSWGVSVFQASTCNALHCTELRKPEEHFTKPLHVITVVLFELANSGMLGSSDWGVGDRSDSPTHPLKPLLPQLLLQLTTVQLLQDFPYIITHHGSASLIKPWLHRGILGKKWDRWCSRGGQGLSASQCPENRNRPASWYFTSCGHFGCQYFHGRKPRS